MILYKNNHLLPHQRLINEINDRVALIRRLHEARLKWDKAVIARAQESQKEFLYVDEMAEASIFMMNLNQNLYIEHTDPILSHINVCLGADFSIREHVETIAKVVSYNGDIQFDTTKPDCTMRKLMDVMYLV